MNSMEQIDWVKKLNVDEMVPWEIKKLCKLMNTIFTDVVNERVGTLKKEKCYGCEVNHPSQRRHDCLMMSEDEAWMVYGAKAVQLIIEEQLISKLFTEAIRVMKLDPHDEVIKHLENLVKDAETTAEFLKSKRTDLSEYQDILGYLYYCNKEH